MKSILIAVTAITLLSSCDRPTCTNTNAVFDAHGIETKAYKEELVKEMKRIGQENLSYWLANYTEENGNEFLTVNIQGEGLCAKGLLQVNDWNKIEGIREAKGVSYRGAELQGLTFDVVAEGESIDFIYSSLEHIID